MFTDELLKIWKDNSLTPPSCPLLVLDNKPVDEVFAVINDSSTTYRIMDINGNIYIIHPKQCANKNSIYYCEGEVIPIFPRYTTTDQFVLTYILPYIFNRTGLD